MAYRLRRRTLQKGHLPMEPPQFPNLRTFCSRLLRRNVRMRQLHTISRNLLDKLGQCAHQTWSFAEKFDVLLVVALLDFLMACRVMEGDQAEEEDVIGALGDFLLSKLDAVGNSGYDDGYREVFRTSLLRMIVRREQTGAAYRWNASYLQTFAVAFNRYFSGRTNEWLECNRAIGRMMLKNLEKSGYTNCFICDESLKDVWKQRLDKCVEDANVDPAAILISTCGHASCVYCFSILTASPEHRLGHEGSTGKCRVCKIPFVWPDHVTQMLLCFCAQWILEASFFRKNDNPVHDIPARILVTLVSEYCIDLERSIFHRGSASRNRYDIWEVIQLQHASTSGLVPMTSDTRCSVESMLDLTKDKDANDEDEEEDEEYEDSQSQDEPEYLDSP